MILNQKDGRERERKKKSNRKKKETVSLSHSKQQRRLCPASVWVLSVLLHTPDARDASLLSSSLEAGRDGFARISNNLQGSKYWMHSFFRFVYFFGCFNKISHQKYDVKRQGWPNDPQRVMIGTVSVMIPPTPSVRNFKWRL